jgi:hypothetical protein
MIKILNKYDLIYFVYQLKRTIKNIPLTFQQLVKLLHSSSTTTPFPLLKHKSADSISINATASDLTTFLQANVLIQGVLCYR